MPKVNNRLMGEKSTNLVTLLQLTKNVVSEHLDFLLSHHRPDEHLL
jgi:hypothetical protein